MGNGGDKSVGLMGMNNKMAKEIMKKGMIVTVVSLAVFFVVLFSVSYVSAYQNLCLTHGESVPNPENPRYTCWSDLCQLCVTNNLNPTNFNKCRDLGACTTLGGNNQIDVTPPTLTINSPKDGEVYNGRKVLFDITSNEPATMSYLDNINGRGRWKRLVSLSLSYYRTRSLKEGLNDLTIKGKDRNGNEGSYDVSFFVDSKRPRVKKSSPRKGFANGKFSVEFSESNPESLVLHYGNFVTGFRTADVDIEGCSTNRGRYYCDVEVNIDDYSGQRIEYWFELEDIAGNVANGKKVSLDVDVVDPIINNIDSYWFQGEGRYNKYIYFEIDLDEDNLDEVSILDNNARRLRWKRICSGLRNGMCVKKVSFKRGHHEVDVMVMDEAGNAISERIVFDVV